MKWTSFVKSGGVSHGPPVLCHLNDHGFDRARRGQGLASWEHPNPNPSVSISPLDRVPQAPPGPGRAGIDFWRVRPGAGWPRGDSAQVTERSSVAQLELLERETELATVEGLVDG